MTKPSILKMLLGHEQRLLREIRGVREAIRGLEKADDAWDRQMDRDAAAGKLDFIRKEARRARRAGKTKPFPKKTKGRSK